MQEIRVTFRIRDVRCASRPIGERSAFATDLSKTRRVLLYVVWQSPKPAGFYAMSCGGMRNLSGIGR